MIDSSHDNVYEAECMAVVRSKLAQGVPFSLSCSACDDGTNVTGLVEAVSIGWTHIEYDDGPSWNFLGLCPNMDCKVEHLGPEARQIEFSF